MSADPSALRIANIYVRSIIEIAVDNVSIYETTTDFQKLEILLEETNELTDFLNNPTIAIAKKRDVLKAIFQSQLGEETLAFVMVVVEAGRSSMLPLIVTTYLKSIQLVASLRVVYIKSAVPLSETHKFKLSQKLNKFFKTREIELIETVEPSLIGGLLIKSDSIEVDLTFKRQIEEIAKYLNILITI